MAYLAVLEGEYDNEGYMDGTFDCGSPDLMGYSLKKAYRSAKRTVKKVSKPVTRGAKLAYKVGKKTYKFKKKADRITHKSLKPYRKYVPKTARRVISKNLSAKNLSKVVPYGSEGYSVYKKARDARRLYNKTGRIGHVLASKGSAKSKLLKIGAGAAYHYMPKSVQKLASKYKAKSIKKLASKYKPKKISTISAINKKYRSPTRTISRGKAPASIQKKYAAKIKKSTPTISAINKKYRAPTRTISRGKAPASIQKKYAAQIKASESKSNVLPLVAAAGAVALLAL